eukprot:CAMPEP_0177768970 /NCGR_PEP_ID=MMETSP0491_2-20121128/10035_1 /TAXON_ID=63592 /ORGANISM="Tetraselmis chuii, Strain PLY429" /LENGTH=991 /DNA_ID=CAMNT_0019285873 /DNA_START=172 /DNA_END=3147 /DNA_ORIENTATION=-
MAEGWRRPGARAALLNCLLLLSAAGVAGRLMAVDFGSENIRVSLVNSNRRPIQVEVVSNEISKRKTSALVGFVNGERLLGEQAAAMDGRYRNSIFARARDMLGRSASDPALKQMLKENYLPFEVVDDPSTGTVRLVVGPEESYTAEELVASIFHYAHKISQEQFGGTFQDCVVVIPPFMGMQQRQAIMDAAAIAGLNVISLIHSHAGGALQYGIERDFSNKTELVVFYDMGAGSVEVSLAKFSSVNKAKKFQQFEILDVAWDNTLGGSSLDVLLMEHFATEFEEKHGLSIREHPKVMSKLRKAVKKTKEVLSANKGAPIYSEELHEGIDFSSSISRDTFEGLAADFFVRAAVPLLAILERNNLTANDVSDIEMLGGGVRVPKLQESLTEALNGRQLSRHFTDPDEAVVIGSGLYAANTSSTFRLRPFGMVDCAPFALKLDIATEGKAVATTEPAAEGVEAPAPAAVEEATTADEEEVKEAESAATTKTVGLLPFRKKLPVKRAVKLGRLLGDTANLTLSYDAESTPLPPGVSDPKLGTFFISGIEQSTKKYNKTGKVTVHFVVGPAGMVTVEKAESVLEVVEYVEVLVPVKEEPKIEKEGAGKEDGAAGEGTKDETAGEGGSDEKRDSTDEDEEAKGWEEKSGGGEEDGGEGKEEGEGAQDEGEKGGSKKKVKKKGAKKEEKAKPKMEKVKKQKKRTVRIPLKVKTVMGYGLSEEALKASRALLTSIYEKDEIKRTTEAAKNELEGFIIDMSSAASDEEFESVSTEAVREKLSADLMALEDWLYEEGENEVAATYRAKLEELHAVVDPILLRVKELTARPEAVETVAESLAAKTEIVKGWAESKPWINGTERDALLETFTGLAEWAAARVKEQEAKEAQEEPAFYSSELLERLEGVEKAFRKLQDKKKPKPPKVEKIETPSKEENATAAEGEEDAGNGQETGEGGDGGDGEEGGEGEGEGEGEGWEAAAEGESPEEEGGSSEGEDGEHDEL